MTSPIRIHCQTLSAIPSVEAIREMADAEHHVVLEFPVSLNADTASIIAQLKLPLTEHSVFCSGGTDETNCITVTPVISKAVILAHVQEIRNAVAMYIAASSALGDDYANGNLSPEWSSFKHGGHRRFESLTTGQVVEAPLSGPPDSQAIDPFFFSCFVKTTPSCAGVAKIIRHDFHDAARILDTLFRD